MTNRAEQLEQLTTYLDGELSPAERAEVERLIATDREARQLLEDLQEMSRLVAALPPEQAPAGLADAVVSRMERRDLLGGELRKSQKVKKSKHQEIEAGGAEVSVVAVWARRFAVAASLALVCTAVWMAWSQWSGPTAERRRPIQLAQADKAPAGRAQGTSRQHNDISPGLAFAPSRRSRPPNPAVPEAQRRVASPSSTPLALGYAGDGDEERIPEAAGPAVSRAAAAKTKMMKPRGEADRQIAARILPTRKEPQPIVVEADGATVAKLTDLIEKDMSRRAIPMLDAESHNEPTADGEAFFTLQRVKPPSRGAGDSDVQHSPAVQMTNEVRIVIHARRDVAGEILSSIRRIAEETGTLTRWRDLSLPLASSRAAGGAIRRLEKHNASEQRDSPAPVDGGMSPKEGTPKEKAAKGGGLIEPLATSAPHNTGKASAEQGPADDHRAVLAKRRSGRLSRPRPTSQAAVARDEPFVTLTIILRAKVVTDSQAGASGTTTKPASQPAATPQW